MPRLNHGNEYKATSFTDMDKSDVERLEAFKTRQQEDLKRPTFSHDIHRRLPFHKRYVMQEDSTWDNDSSSVTDVKGEEAWRNTEGESLEDFGVDEAAEFYDEDEVPPAKILSHKRTQDS